MPCIHLTGAAGTGVTTIGRKLAQQLGVPFFDVDDIYWLPTNPPYQSKRPVPERIRLLTNMLQRAGGNWVLAGSLMGWGDQFIPRFTHVIFLYVDVEERLRRVSAREASRFGTAIQAGGTMHAHYPLFLDWVKGYETGALGGRSLPTHRAWLAALPPTLPVLKLEENLSVEQTLTRLTTFLK